MEHLSVIKSQMQNRSDSRLSVAPCHYFRGARSTDQFLILQKDECPTQPRTQVERARRERQMDSVLLNYVGSRPCTSIQSLWGLHIDSLVSTFPWKTHGSSETWKGSLVVLKRLTGSSLLPLENRGYQQSLCLGLPANCPRADPARASSESRTEQDPTTCLPGQGPAHSPSPSPLPN